MSAIVEQETFRSLVRASESSSLLVLIYQQEASVELV